MRYSKQIGCWQLVNPGGVKRIGGKPYPASFVFTSSKDSAIAGEAAPAMYTDSSAPHDLIYENNYILVRKFLLRNRWCMKVEQPNFSVDIPNHLSSYHILTMHRVLYWRLVNPRRSSMRNILLVQRRYDFSPIPPIRIGSCYSLSIYGPVCMF